MLNRLLDRYQRIAFLTDVEGNWSYFKDWCDRSELLSLKKTAHDVENPDCRWTLDFNTVSSSQYFVYGGDVCDKGPGDLRMMDLLLRFKLAHQEQVILLAGNRDLKYLRFKEELSGDIKQRLLHGDSVFWNPTARPRDYLIKDMQQQGINDTSLPSLQEYLTTKTTTDCQSLYLHWMLEETMGCALPYHPHTTYEYRRQELALLANLTPDQISDEAVVHSFIEAIEPNGLMARYLKQTKIAYILGDTLFLHGAITPDNMGFVPGEALRFRSLADWVDALNRWYVNALDAVLSDSAVNDGLKPAQSPIDQYIVKNPRSVIIANWYDNGLLAPISETVVSFLNQAGIYRVVSGHQPFSDFPLIIREPRLEVIVGDTSYSDMQAPHDTRGQATHQLMIYQKQQSSYAVIDAIRRDGATTWLRLPTKRQASTRGDFLSVGHFTPEGHLIRLQSNNTLVGSQLDGFNITDHPMKADVLCNEVTDANRRAFLVGSASVMGGVGAACALTPFLMSWLPSAKAIAKAAPVQVDLSQLEPGQQITVAWRGKPVWIIRRTPQMLKDLETDEAALRDPASLVKQQPVFATNRYRSLKPEYLVLIGICTHLGCSPKYVPTVKELGPQWVGGFFCPCHGSTFDLAGRVFKGVPAPINLEVPPYRFITDELIEIG